MSSTEKGARTPKGAEPVRLVAAAPPQGDKKAHNRLLFVSAGLSPEGGGIAAAGRLLLGATASWARERDVHLRVLSLGGSSDIPVGVEGSGFDGSRARLASAVWRAQALEGFRAQIFDFLGVARIQGVLPRALRARYLLYLYGIECWQPLRGSRRRALHGATARLACSRHTVERLERANPDTPPVEPVPLALEPEAKTAAAPDQALLETVGEGFLLIVGRMAAGERYKGHDELLAALRHLTPADPVRLVVAGGGEDQPRLESEASRLGIADRVQFTGFVDGATLSELYRRCTALVMPSTGEGFGLVYLEAMRAAKPCVALAGSAAAEIVIDGVTGLLIAPGAEPLAAAITTLMANPARREALGGAGRERFLQHFRAESFAARLHPHLDALLLGRVTEHVEASTTDAPTPRAAAVR